MRERLKRDGRRRESGRGKESESEGEREKSNLERYSGSGGL